jgi:hypothetical protein
LVCIVSGSGEAERCTPCGGAGQPCCDDDACGDGAFCDDGECVGCGSTGLSCCEESACDDGFNCDDDGFCVACGGDGLACCDEGDACGEGLTCSQGNQCVACGGEGDLCCAEGDACVGDDLVCNDGECESCGGGGDLCCAGGTCDTGFTCDPDGIACVACGAAAGQLCCDTGDPCGTGLVCSGGSCTPCGGSGQTCCAGDVCGDDLVCDEDGACASCGTGAVVCGTGGDAQCVPGVCCEDEGEGPGCAEGETCIAGGCIDDDEVRIVLRWGAEPRDLDSHLWLPVASPDHIAWFDKGALGAFPFAELDIDDVSGIGPETITIADLQAGTYLYAVHLFAGTGTIGTSGATVQVHQGANLLATYSPPAEGPWDTQDPTANPYNDRRIWWKVFELTSDGTDAVLTGINVSSTDPAPYGTSGPPLFRSAGMATKPAVAEGNGARRRRRKARNRGRARR